ncbi:MAG: 5-formyltetrahydrofolate cyclo-ligase [Oligoflexia bacterium]|nr:5-formyltetrahydrofolate cyclo-ligase [Oligoflexia bacterium]
MTDTLQDLRLQALACRRAQPISEAQSLGEAISGLFVAAFEKAGLGEHLQGMHVGFFRPLPEEPSLASLERWLRANGAKLYYPRVEDLRERRMELAEVASEDNWVSGRFGIEEPHPSVPAVNPECLDLVFVPGVVFGMQGERVGMGAGFYDRYLVRTSRALRAAAAFDFQLYPQLAQKPWDQAMDWIVTPTREVRTARLAAWLERVPV